ncbi:MAG: hypothetical protein F4100_01045 [Rhodothermaceae bacterium]|nr:hypothetical protein [Bacteroidota bacterium]MYE27707.1 hypothetical protein [Chloroflexota bacterium]MYE63073.1 hypothetical protein [Rhodothermaceae bacterium]MYJ19323.1 hypothetical protein [Rhodothermaceae bacterium]
MKSDKDHGSRLWWLLSVVVVIGGFLLGSTGLLPGIPSIEIHWPTESSMSGYIPSYADTLSPEIMMIYIGSSTCGYCNDSDLPAQIEAIKLGLQNKASERRWHFTATGVSIDWSTSEGVKHLDKFGLFDEIMTGRKWKGRGAHLFFSQMPGPAATPQVLVIGRNPVFVDDPDSQPIFKEKLIHRVVGRFPIENWVNRSLPLPQDILDEFEREAIP